MRNPEYALGSSARPACIGYAEGIAGRGDCSRRGARLQKCGRDWTRTSDPLNVNEVRYQLRYATKLMTCRLRRPR
ncbi:MAG: hypothetical protein UW22_C0061G0007 [Candidatus Gottesmanbacteria bacterium GW2011_GWB1_44_11c]|uniref:Uncharacterized protein n=1 Tax=Candidatus Gottesmanbacteria bacterium GW2011_GWB1_44_11c TaxID=1618447 RepID=A0A0G1GKX1_9BACT|nr:MAG: hypothetical protein UW22_C0061G0007 [Candidatus Gottesmanbacteria bacterium GW2011_GWB1_44_11c]